jgi:hypothetical protein
MVIAIAMLLGSFNTIAFAEGDGAGDAEIFKFFEGNIVTKIDQNNTFTIPEPLNGSTVSVKAPSGSEKVFNSEERKQVLASQIGNYIVTYATEDGKNKYSFNVLSYEDREYFVVINETEADFLPTYAAKGDSIKIPDWDLAYTNDDGEVVPLNLANNANVKKLTYDANFVSAENGETVEGGRVTELKGLNTGTLNLEFKARANEESDKWLTLNRTVKVQNGFKDTKAPTLNALNVTKSANINTLYNVTTASASDDYQEKDNVFIKVTVVDPDGADVKTYEANDYGYADLSTEGEAVKFDNKTTTNFYPTKIGNYIIRYVAIDGSRNQSPVHSYSVAVSDKLAPQIIDIAENQIPSKWGINTVKMSDGEETPAATDRPERNLIYLPLPEIADNNAVVEGVYSPDELSLTVTLKNSERTIAQWTGEYGDFKSETGVALTETYLKNFVTKKTGVDSTEQDMTEEEIAAKYNFTVQAGKGMPFAFDYLDFTTSNFLEESQRTGDWTLTYSVKDAAANGDSGNAKRTYTIQLSNSFSDIKKPTISEDSLNLPKYILIDEDGETFDIPVIDVSDTDEIRLSENYTISTDSVVSSLETIYLDDETYQVENSHKVKGGERFEVREFGGSYYIIIKENNQNYAVKIGTANPRVTFNYSAIDAVGNVSTLNDENGKGKYGIDLLFPSSISQELAFTSNIEANSEEAKQANTMRLGGFVVENILHRDYTGFEFEIQNSKGKSETVTLDAYYLQTGTLSSEEPMAALQSEEESETKVYSLNVENIEFVPSLAGDYILSIKIFDISGMSYVYSYAFNVEENVVDDDIIVTTAAVIGDTGEINTPYELNKKYTISSGIGEIASKSIMRHIRGKAFSLVGNDFTGKVASSYFFHDYVRLEYLNGEVETLSQKTYDIAITDSEKPVIEVQGELTTYYSQPLTAPEDETVFEEGKYIELPVITAYTKRQNVDVVVTVVRDGSSDFTARKVYLYTNESGYEIKTFKDKDSEGNMYTYSGYYAFPASEDGQYIVTATATVGASTEYKELPAIRVGDLIAPQFDVTVATTANVGDSYVIAKPSFSTEARADLETLTVNLYNSSNTLISTASKSIRKIQLDDFNYDTGYKFEKSGTYRVEYITVDAAGNEAKKVDYIEVNGTGSSSQNAPKALTTVLIILGALLIIAVVIYFVRFRAKKPNAKK